VGVVTSATAAAILGQRWALYVPTFRPPTVPVSFAQLAARDRGNWRTRSDDADPPGQ
jgi:hypothetical protein